MQNDPNQTKQLIYSVVGLHALTMSQNPKRLQKDRLYTLASILAVGVDPEEAILFFQEDVSGFSIETFGFDLDEVVGPSTCGACLAFELPYDDGSAEAYDYLEGSYILPRRRLCCL
jgi:tryptophanyl-tRNA synthetase